MLSGVLLVRGSLSRLLATEATSILDVARDALVVAKTLARMLSLERCCRVDLLVKELYSFVGCRCLNVGRHACLPDCSPSGNIAPLFMSVYHMKRYATLCGYRYTKLVQKKEETNMPDSETCATTTEGVVGNTNKVGDKTQTLFFDPMDFFDLVTGLPRVGFGEEAYINKGEGF